ncbi:MAG TPA: hypothetical protein VFU02_12545 [Polyangiaceae bacterium]|nr:hypothetical protein [Polyangiaceae bacterium]
MLRFGLLVGLVFVTSCKTLHEADAAMQAWTREHLHPDEEEENAVEHSSKQGPTGDASAQPVASGPPASQASAANTAPDESFAEAAQPPDAARGAAAEALFESGHEAMSKGDYDTACARFAESNRLDPAVGSLLNLAACEEKRGRLATSWQLFKRVMSDLPPGDDRYPIAQRRASALRPRVPHVTLKLASDAPKQTTVKYGAVVLGHASFDVPLPFDPGEHRLLVGAPEREARAYTVVVSEGETKVLTVGPGDPK